MNKLNTFLSASVLSALLLQSIAVPTLAKNIFVDHDDIINHQAIDVVNALELMTGDDQGYFNPNSVVTRGEMAVICTKMLYGSDFPVFLFTGEPVFSDVPSWAECYVNAAVSEGIVTGYGDGTFGTDDPVNTVQCLLMILKTLGYFALPSEFGENWVSAVLMQGGTLGFFNATDITADTAHDPITRENVASLVFYALTQVPEVSYNHAFQAYYPTGGSMTNHIS